MPLRKFYKLYEEKVQSFMVPTYIYVYNYPYQPQKKRNTLEILDHFIHSNHLEMTPNLELFFSSKSTYGGIVFNKLSPKYVHGPSTISFQETRSVDYHVIIMKTTQPLTKKVCECFTVRNHCPSIPLASTSHIQSA